MGENREKQYSFFDHIIESQFDLPELHNIGGPERTSIVYIRMGNCETGFDCKPHGWCHHWKTTEGVITLSLTKNEKGFLLEVPQLARFQIRADGKLVTCYPGPSTPSAITRHLLLDQILPRLFAHFHGYPVVHAGCVALREKGICFLGNSGSGKSTLATGFARAGYSVLTDDCLYIRKNKGQVFGVPSYNSLRLLHDSISAFDLNVSDKDDSGLNSKGKIRVPLQVTTTSSTVLQTMFLLIESKASETCNKPEIAEVSKSMAVKELLRQSFSLDISDSHYLKRQFSQIVDIVSSDIGIYSLRYPRGFQVIPEILYAIERAQCS